MSSVGIKLNYLLECRWGLAWSRHGEL